MTEKPVTILGSIEGNHIHRRHVEPRVQLSVPKEESFLSPLRYIDVVRTTHTTLDVLQESRIDDYWNIDANRNSSESSCNSQYWVKNLLTDICGPGCGFQKFKQQPGLISGDQKFGPECQKQPNEKKSSNGLSRNRSSTMCESWEATILLIQMKRSSRKPSNTH